MAEEQGDNGQDSYLLPLLATLIGAGGLGYAGHAAGKAANNWGKKKLSEDLGSHFREYMNVLEHIPASDRANFAPTANDHKDKKLWELAENPGVPRAVAGLGGLAGAGAGYSWEESRENPSRSLAALLGALAAGKLSHKYVGELLETNSALAAAPGALIGAGLGSSMENYISPFGRRNERS